MPAPGGFRPINHAKETSRKKFMGREVIQSKGPNGERIVETRGSQTSSPLFKQSSPPPLPENKVKESSRLFGGKKVTETTYRDVHKNGVHSRVTETVTSKYRKNGEMKSQSGSQQIWDTTNGKLTTDTAKWSQPSSMGKKIGLTAAGAAGVGLVTVGALGAEGQLG
jgi:hypothetical protein